MSDQNQAARLPQSVYRRRRIAVLAVLLAVVAVIVMVVAGPARVASWFGGSSGGGSSSNSAGAKPDNSANDADSGTDSETDSDASDNGGAAGEDAKPVVPGPCDPAELAVEAVTDADEYAEGDLPQLSLRVTNHAKVQCDADLGTSTMLFEVKSGSELYWSSRDCQTDAAKNLVRLEPGQTLETEPFAWDRTRSSAESCDAEREDVPAGGSSYHLSVEIAGSASQNTKQFLLY